MPKVMMIGKVSKLGRRTRKAGSFKGMLGTVVLEGSRAQSRRYGMGNIGGSPAEHLEKGKRGVEGLERAVAWLKRTPCDAEGSRLGEAMRYMQRAGEVGTHLSEAGIKTDSAPGRPVRSMPTFPANDLGYRYRLAVRNIVRAAQMCNKVMSTKWEAFEAQAHGEAQKMRRPLPTVAGARRRR
jgi:hypothetical protein